MISPIAADEPRTTPQWPAPEFEVLGARDVPGTFAPTLGFEMRVRDRSERRVQMMALCCEIRIDPARRELSRAERIRLHDMLGAPGSVSSAGKLAWARADVIVAGFTASATFELEIPCTFDLGLATSRYLEALGGGSAWLQFLFSGSVYCIDDERVQIVPIPWDREALFELPAAEWKRMMSRHHPEGSWVRLRAETIDRLRETRTRAGVWSDDEAIRGLLEAAQGALLDAPRAGRIDAARGAAKEI